MTVDELEVLVAERVERGECGCGCGGEIPKPKAGKKQRQKFLPDHRQRLYKRKVQVTAAERGLEPRLSLKTLNPPGTTKDRSRYAQSQGKPAQASKSKPRKPSGAQIAWGRATAELADWLVRTERMPESTARVQAAAILGHALSDKQRKRVNPVPF